MTAVQAIKTQTQKLIEILIEIYARRSGLKIAAEKERTPKPLQRKNSEVGAGGRTRTGTLLPAVDFESRWSCGIEGNPQDKTGIQNSPQNQ